MRFDVVRTPIFQFGLLSYCLSFVIVKNSKYGLFGSSNSNGNTKESSVDVSFSIRAVALFLFSSTEMDFSNA